MANDLHLERDPTFLPLVWGLYVVGAMVLVLRFAVRIKSVGFRGLQGDDAFAFIILLAYTVDAITVNYVYLLGSNVEAAALQAKGVVLTQAEVDQFVLGSKLQYTAWFSYTLLLWSLKGTMLCFFARIVGGTWQKKLVNWLSYACAASYLAVVLTLFFGCFPTYKNYQVLPDPGLKCTFRIQNFLVAVVLNVVTDAAILCIPLPLLWTLQIPLKKKLVIGLLICSGFFVIAAAIIRVVLTLGANPSGTNINRWGVIETIVGIISVNIPALRPMFNKSFWTGVPTTKGSTYGGVTTIGGGRRSKLHKGDGDYEMAPSVTDGLSMHKRGSDESILGMPANKTNGIQVRTEFVVRRIDGGEASGNRTWVDGGHSPV